MNSPVNLTTLHANLKTQLAAQFPTCTVDYYPRPGDKIKTPALLIDLDDIDASDPDNNGAEQVEVTLRLNVYAVESYKDGKKLAVRNLAAAVMAFVRGKKWSCPVGAARVIGAYRDTFQGDPLEYECRRIEIEHDALLGIDVWIDDGDVPEEVNVSEQGNEHTPIVEAE
jgi:hypothetical protein